MRTGLVQRKVLKFYCTGQPGERVLVETDFQNFL